MSAPAITSNLEYPLSLDRGTLQFGQLSLSLGTVLKFWVFTTVKEVHLHCQSKNDKAYKTNLTLQLGSIEKTKECVALLLLHTNASASPPTIKSLQPKDCSVLFSFRSEISAIEFSTYYALPFFPKEKYNHELLGCVCKIVDKAGESETFKLTVRDFYLRIFGLQDNRSYSSSFVGKHLRSFLATPTEIHFYEWSKRGKKSTFETDDQAFTNWVELSLIEQEFQSWIKVSFKSNKQKKLEHFLAQADTKNGKFISVNNM